jgi:uncharacterized membrane protein YphA (DoxX/SURF4 family)
MSGTGTTSQTPSTTATRRRALNIALWAMQALLALMFAMAGLSKVFGGSAMVEMFATIGIGQWFRYVVGALEIAGAAGVLVPRLSGLAALGLLCLMAGAAGSWPPFPHAVRANTATRSTMRVHARAIELAQPIFLHSTTAPG